MALDALPHSTSSASSLSRSLPEGTAMHVVRVTEPCVHV